MSDLQFPPMLCGFPVSVSLPMILSSSEVLEIKKKSQSALFIQKAKFSRSQVMSFSDNDLELSLP